MRRSWSTRSWVLGVLAAVAVGAVLLLLGSPDDPAPRRAEPSPRTGPLAPAPRTIPAVRSWTPERGQGWRPGADTRVVADPRGPLADEARLLARELKVPYATGRSRAGDVDLVLDDGAGTGREGYQLTVRADRVTVRGTHDAGVFYGTRTLLQAVRDRGRLPEGVVRDRPDRPQRGLLLDIARKHYSVRWIEDRVRELGDLKFNQLQLHFSDDQAFRVESASHPEVVSEPRLTKTQLRGLVRLAAARHITVIPEIGSPGHLGAVLAAHPELQLRDAQGTAVRGALDISRPGAAPLVDALLREYAPLFVEQPGPGPYWHLGGDEYGALLGEDPEAAHPALARQARRTYGPGATVRDLVTGWLNDRAKLVRSLGAIPQVWNDGLHQGGRVRARQDRQVAYWTGKEIGAQEPDGYLRAGWKVVNLNDAYLYYVLGEPQQFHYPTGERIYREWTPAVLRGSTSESAALTGPDQVLGARFAVWGDVPRAQTAEEVAEGIRLPLRALAQKVWDPRSPKRQWHAFTELAQRLE